jgi:hypothetical protein
MIAYEECVEATCHDEAAYFKKDEMLALAFSAQVVLCKFACICFQLILDRRLLPFS